MKPIKIILLFLICNISISAQGYTTISSNIASNTTWTTGNTYYVSTSIDVNDGATLTIEPGVVVKFAHGARLYVPGILDVNGSDLSSNFIVFTSIDDNSYGETITESDGVPSAGDWLGLYGYGDGGHPGQMYFDYAIVRYGGNASGPDANVFWTRGGGYFKNGISEYSATEGIKGRDVYFTVSDSEIRNNGGIGVSSESAYVNNIVAVYNNTFTSNGSYAAYITADKFSNISGNSGTLNGINGFAISSSMSGSQTISGFTGSFPLILVGTINIDQADQMTIEAGQVIKSDLDCGFVVSGKIVANGSSNNAIVFTSFKDDTYGGDTNGDGSDTAPSPGDWYGILITNSGNYSTEGGQGTFSNCIFRYGGDAGSSYNANVGISTSAFTTSFQNCVFEYSATNGIYVYDAYVKARSCRIIDNGTYGVYAAMGYHSNTVDLGDYSLDNGNNRFTGNGSDAIYNDGYDILAESNYWGVATDPEIAGKITIASGTVDYEPWLESDPTTVPLPVELTSFQAISIGNEIQLKWITATEVNNYGFSVERKLLIENYDWKEIGFVEGSGNSNSVKEYSFVDNSIPQSTSRDYKIQYKLKQIDIDGNYEYSKIVSVEISCNESQPEIFALHQNYPNPFNPSTVIRYSLPVRQAGIPAVDAPSNVEGLQNVTLKVYDILGNEVATLVNENQLVGNYEVTFNASGLASGIYFYKLQTSNGFVATRKLMLMK